MEEMAMKKDISEAAGTKSLVLGWAFRGDFISSFYYSHAESNQL